MNNLEDNLRQIKIKELTEENKESLWHSIIVRRIELERNKSRLSGFNVFNFSMKKIIVGVIALVLILGGSGVVAASNNAVPGSSLFPVELALENIQLKFSGDDKREELYLRFVEERLEEIREVSEKRSVPSSTLVTDLSNAVTIEIEVDVFTNETIVKIEADNKNYGYISALKVKTDLVKEISLKYSLTEEKVNSVIDFEIEDRESRAEDKGFLNKTHSINFSENESEDVSQVLSDIDQFLNQNGEDQNKEELKKSLAAILILLGDDGDLEIKRDNGKIKIETKNGEVKIKVEKENDDSKNDNDNVDNSSDSDDSENEDNTEDNINDDNDNEDSLDDSISSDDIDEEDDSEVFCRGEWREPEDCEENDSNNSSDDNNDDSYNQNENDDDNVSKDESNEDNKIDEDNNDDSSEEDDN